MEQELSNTQRRLALQFRLNKIQSSGIYGPILLNELLIHKYKDCKPEIKEGFLKIITSDKEKPEICWHLWVESGSNKFDINILMAENNDEEFKACDFEYLEDDGDIKPPEDLYDQWKLYQKDKKEFWKKSPMKLKNFRSKLFKKK